MAIGVPAYNEGDHLDETLGSLRGQTFTDFGAVVVDNCSTDATSDIARRFAEADPRFRYVRREDHVGLVYNFRAAYRHALAAHPLAPYFLWLGGHDVLDPDFLAVLVAELDSAPEVVGAWPSSFSSRGDAEIREDPLDLADTVGVGDVGARFRVGVPGVALHGLLRPAPVARAGIKRLVLLPDRLLMAELSLYGELKHVPRRLWRRRLPVERQSTRGRQRASVFTGRAPLYAYLPWQLQHAGALFLALSFEGRGLPEMGRSHGPRVAWEYLRTARWIDHRGRKRIRRAEVTLRAVRIKARVRVRPARKRTRRLLRRLRPTARRRRRAVKRLRRAGRQVVRLGGRPREGWIGTPGD